MTAGPRFPRLDDWLEWQQSLHPNPIDLGLERVSRVLGRTGWRGPRQPVITVGGTNGKGSCVAMLDALLRAGGYRVGTFTSPHLVDYRERIRLDGARVSEASLVAAFERIADALEGDSLTFFEFNTLAALLVFETWAPDAIVLEVGLGGRLDAVNVVDADVAIVVSVALDHMEWLGPDLESIGREKAGIFRRARPAVCGMAEPPRALSAVAEEVGAPLLLRGRDFDAVEHADGRWDFRDAHGDAGQAARASPRGRRADGQRGHGARGAAAARRPVAARPCSDRVGARERAAAGPLSARAWRRRHRVGARRRAQSGGGGHVGRESGPPCGAGRTVAVCGMLDDKDVGGVLVALRDRVDRWFAATTEGPRGLADTALAARARAVGVEMVAAGSVTDAMRRAAREARAGDRIVVFGSFHTVGPALACV